MSLVRILVLLASTPVAAYTVSGFPQAVQDDDTLGKVIANIENTLASLSDVTCQQRVRRYSDVGGREKPLDVITMSVDHVEALESYSDIRKLNSDGTTRRRDKRIIRLANLGGAWSYGEFFSVLRITEGALTSATPIVARLPDRTSNLLAIFFRCAGACWTIRVHSKLYWMAIDGELQVDPETGEVRELQWLSTGLPRELGIEKVELTISYRPTTIGGRSWTVPVSSMYRVSYSEANRAERNVSEFTSYQRFGSESSLTFESVTGPE